MDVAGRVVRFDSAVLSEHDSAGVNVLVDHEGRHSGESLAIDDSPVDRSCAPVLGQEGRMEVESAELRH